MTVDLENPFLSASPDVEGSCACCGKFVIEIKCLYSVCETVPTADNLEYLGEVVTDMGTVVALKQKHPYYTQILGQLAITRTKLACFFIYAHNGYHLEKNNFDEQHWGKNKENLVFCWYKYLAPTSTPNNTLHEIKLLQKMKAVNTIEASNVSAQTKSSQNITSITKMKQQNLEYNQQGF